MGWRGNHRLIRGQSSSHQRAISGNHQIVLRGNHHLIRGAAIIISFSRTSSTSLRVPSGSRYGTRKSEMPAAPAGAFGVRARSMCTWQWGERGPLRGERGPSNAPSCAREHTLRPAGPLRCQQRHSGAIECHQYAYDVVAQVMKGACRPHLGATHPIGADTSTTIGVRLGHCHCADRR